MPQSICRSEIVGYSSMIIHW